MSEKKIGKLTVRIERDQCIGSGNCVKIAPTVFELDDDGLVAFRSDGEDPGPEKVLDACQVCPVEALFVMGENGESLVP